MRPGDNFPTGAPSSWVCQVDIKLRHHGTFTQRFWCLTHVEASWMDRGKGARDLPFRTQG